MDHYANFRIVLDIILLGGFMKNSRFQTLRAKLSLLLMLFALIPVIAASFVLLTSIQRTSLSDQKTEVNSQLTLVNDHVDSVFQDMLYNVGYLAKAESVQSLDDSITQYTKTATSTQMTPSQNGDIEKSIYKTMSTFGKTHSNYRYVSLGTEDGGYIQYPAESINAGFDPRARDWYKAAKESPGAAIIGEPYYFETDNIVLVSVSQAIQDNNGKVLGVMLIDISLDALTNVFDKASSKSKGSYLLTTQDGTIVSDPSNPQNNFTNIADSQESLYHAIAAQSDFNKIKINKSQFYISSMKSVKTGWYFTSIVEESVILKTVRTLGQVIFVLLAAVFAIVVAVGSFASRGITAPILAVANAADQIAGGDFDVSIDIQSEGEIGNLVSSFKKIGVTLQEYKKYIEEISSILNQIADGDMTFALESEYIGEFSAIKTALLNISDTLTQTLTQIKISSDHIASGAEQVSAGSQSLSQGATEQASAIEQLSASIAEVTDQINDNATKALDARDKTILTGKEISSSNAEMAKMTEAMSMITEKATEISKIIKIIDDIAFQTNILALNAAVEAARAGEVGRGFAVVADEVRNLAARSAEAAKNTASLIEETIDAVQVGSSTSKITAESLSKSAQEANHVVQLIASIAEASQAQAQAIIQINQGVDQVSSVVQTTAATAEESAATSEELSGQSVLLNQAISQFRLHQGACLSSYDSAFDSSHREDFYALPSDDKELQPLYEELSTFDVSEASDKAFSEEISDSDLELAEYKVSYTEGEPYAKEQLEDQTEDEAPELRLSSVPIFDEKY